MARRSSVFVHLLLGGISAIAISFFVFSNSPTAQGQINTPTDPAVSNAQKMITEGRQTFRYDTFGDEAFWGGQLHLNDAIAGVALGGVGVGLTPRAALAFGLKVDVDALTSADVNNIQSGQLNLDSTATTLALLREDAIVGLKGVLNTAGDRLTSVGIQCALCHSTVDDSLAPGIGHRLDGLANRDLNIGAIVAAAPNLQPIAGALDTDVASALQVLRSWGPGKFDIEVFLDGKAFNPAQVSNGVVTGRNVSGATMIPNALGLAGFDQHTWTGAWGTVSYWNALVANVVMHGKGTFFDPRLDNRSQFPLAAKKGYGHIRTASDDDRITPKLAALHFYQLSLPMPTPTPSVHFSPQAAQRGDALFTGKARCNECHVKPLWTEPGWNLHKADEIGIDSFQADRAPDHAYKTQNLAGLFIHELGLYMMPANRGRFFHDGRYATLLDVVNHYNTHFNLALTDGEKLDLVEYLKSLPEAEATTSATTIQVR